MLGAIIGDIVGSRWEFHPTNDYNFELFSYQNEYTDDTICTVAMADALLKNRDYGESLHDWCRRYMKPKGGFGARFRKWVESNEPKPYGSYGNGSAMRVSPIAMWFCTNGEKVKEEAGKSAACTHNHPEGIKGAQAVAFAISNAISRFDGRSAEEVLPEDVLALVVETLSHFDYDTDTDYEAYRNLFDETCQRTVPPALDIIRRSTSFEDAIRKAVSLGADADTLGAIVGSIAEHIWGIPQEIKDKAMDYLSGEMCQVVEDFYKLMESKADYKPKAKEAKRNADLEAETRKRWEDFLNKKREKEIERYILTDKAVRYMRCIVAGTQFIEDQSLFYKFEENDRLTLKPEDNIHDVNAVALYFKDKKIGYVPRKQNAELARLLRMGWGNIFLAYVTNWVGCGEKRQITVEIFIKHRNEDMPVDFEDTPEWWSRRMIEILDRGPRTSVYKPWELWTRTYDAFVKNHSVALNRPEGFVHCAIALCMELLGERYECTKSADSEEIEFRRLYTEEGGFIGTFGFDKGTYLSYIEAEDCQLYFSTGGNTGMLAGRTCPEKLDEMYENEVFVFGSNTKGHHTGGAALLAMKKFGAVYGEGDGLQGQSYAISTSDGLVETAMNINRFISFAAQHQELRFFVTPIGCGHAGYNPLQIAPLFRKALLLPNVILPHIFWEYYWMTQDYGPDYFVPDKDWKKWDKR